MCGRIALSLAAVLLSPAAARAEIFVLANQGEVHGELVNKSFEFNAATNSLTVKKKYRKLNLRKESDNQIVIIEDGKRSNGFTLRL